MKAILEFNLPEDNVEHLTAIQAPDWKFVVSEIDEYLRSQIKYSNLSDEVSKALQLTRDEMGKLCTDNNLDIHS